VGLEGLGEFKNRYDLVGSGTRDLPAGSMVKLASSLLSSIVVGDRFDILLTFFKTALFLLATYNPDDRTNVNILGEKLVSWP
jgi:hypothetical protein